LTGPCTVTISDLWAIKELQQLTEGRHTIHCM
jgi:hypothetical protein